MGFNSRRTGLEDLTSCKGKLSYSNAMFHRAMDQDKNKFKPSPRMLRNTWVSYAWSARKFKVIQFIQDGSQSDNRENELKVANSAYMVAKTKKVFSFY